MAEYQDKTVEIRDRQWIWPSNHPNLSVYQDSGETVSIEVLYPDNDADELLVLGPLVKGNWTVSCPNG